MSDPEFRSLQNLRILDSLYRKLHSAGIGTSVKKTEVLDDENKEKLWASDSSTAKISALEEALNIRS